MREKLYWFVDSLKGKLIRNHYNDIEFINQSKNVQTVNIRREELIERILTHATETTPFYKEFKHSSRLDDFPVLNKTLVQKRFDDFKSEAFLNKPKFRVATSGSTGVPFFLYQDLEKKLRNTADTIYFLNQANYKVGEPLYNLEVWGNTISKKPLKTWLQNLRRIEVSHFNDAEVESFLGKLKKSSSPINLLGFVSAYERICQYLDSMGSGPLSNIQTSSITANSEFLPSYVKHSMEKYFGTQVVSRYSNEELGIIAQQYPVQDEGQFNINWASYHIEILKMDSDAPADLGEMGRVIVTDLFNYCMPMIRYDTGDISLFDTLPSASNPFPSLKRVEGRRMDIIYNTNGEVISSFVIYTLFHRFYSLLKQYQFIQTGEKEYLLKLNTHSGEFNSMKDLIKDVQKEFGMDANVTVELVKEIPPLSSGKRKKVVNMYR